MPLLLVIIGVTLLASALNGRTSYLLSTVQSEFTGQQNFLVWLGAIGVIGAIGYIPGARTAANWLLAIVLIAMFIANNRGTSGGFFAQFNQAIASTQNASASNSTQQASTSNATSMFTLNSSLPTLSTIPELPSLPSFTLQDFNSSGGGIGNIGATAGADLSGLF